MRVTVLWSSLTGYLVATLNALNSRGARIQLVHRPPLSNAPFSELNINRFEQTIQFERAKYTQILEKLRAFSPEVLICCGWSYRAYLKYVAALRHSLKCHSVITIDNQWTSSLRQRLGVVYYSKHLCTLFDSAWVPGPRQMLFANQIGLPIIPFLYCADSTLFKVRKPYEQRSAGFLFVGRLVKEKGIRILSEAYSLYKRVAQSPWELTIVGNGPQDNLLPREGIKQIPFTTPDRLSELMNDASAYIQPSIFEPWGVSIHEAAQCGLPIISSNVCGANDYFLHHSMNGYIGKPDPYCFAEAMCELSSQPQDLRMKMSAYSSYLGGTVNHDSQIQCLLNSLSLKEHDHQFRFGRVRKL